MTDSEKELVEPSMTDDELKEWVSELDRRANVDCGGGGWIDPFPIENTVNWKSARAIEQLLRERDEARAERDDLETERRRLVREYFEETLKVARLREALRVIAACEGKLTAEPDVANAAAINAVARAALEEAKHD